MPATRRRSLVRASSSWICRASCAGSDVYGSFPSLSLGALRRSALGYKGCFHSVEHLEGEFRRLFIQPLRKERRAALGQQQLLHGFDWSVIDGLAQVHARIAAHVRKSAALRAVRILLAPAAPRTWAA